MADQRQSSCMGVGRKAGREGERKEPLPYTRAGPEGVTLLKSLVQNQLFLLAPFQFAFKVFAFVVFCFSTKFALVNDNELVLSEELELLG